jgi:2,4-dienoyl-CoA reductase-like NADH-dependent reductase (Old Yellow Enzyme family)
MPDLFSPYTLKGVTLRNRIAMSPMTMYRSVDGLMNDFHVMLMGSRAAGGFGLVPRPRDYDSLSSGFG